MKGLTKKKISRKVSKKNRKTNMKGGSYSSPLFSGFVEEKQERLNFEKQQQENKYRSNQIERFLSNRKYALLNNAQKSLKQKGINTHGIISYLSKAGPRMREGRKFLIVPKEYLSKELPSHYKIESQPPPQLKVPQQLQQPQQPLKYNPDNSAAKAAKASKLSSNMSGKLG